MKKETFLLFSQKNKFTKSKETSLLLLMICWREEMFLHQHQQQTSWFKITIRFLFISKTERTLQTS
uniref:Uncharacterized protein n=1 Tax=uncultured marine virus TaxID=186617 RepID=A0A0F7L7T4_9VIRU|nr:hypothetical protein [uncultured marine virus]